MNFEILRYVALIGVAAYFILDYLDSRRVKDEREELIQLKTFELVHKLTLASLSAIAIAFLYDPYIPGIYPIMVVVLATMYGEIFGRIYYRRKY